MIPHISGTPRLAELARVARLAHLPRPGDRERVGLDVLRDRGAGRDIGAPPQPYRGDRLAIAPHEDVVLDHGLVLAVPVDHAPVVVAGHEAAADVHAAP